jgi:hypothetical protein
MHDGRNDREATVLLAGGTAFLTVAGVFLWRDLDIPHEMLLLAAALGLGVAAVLGWPRRWPALAPLALLAAAGAGGLWFLVDQRPALLPALTATLAATLAAVIRAEGTDEAGADTLAHRLRWYGLGAALLAASFGFYFHFLTTGIAADTVARRLVPTVGWLVLGLALFVAGRPRTRAARQVGAGLVAVALAKAAIYDTTHLAGAWRVLGLAAVGALLLFASSVVRRPAVRALGER